MINNKPHEFNISPEALRIQSIEAENAELKMRLEEAEKTNESLHEEVLDEIQHRDHFENQCADMAAQAGCSEEWSNLHDHSTCVREEVGLLLAKLTDLETKLQAAENAELRQTIRGHEISADIADEQIAELKRRLEFAHKETEAFNQKYEKVLFQWGEVKESLASKSAALEKLRVAVISRAKYEHKDCPDEVCNNWEDHLTFRMKEALTSLKTAEGKSEKEV